jgi:putative FmdB family regulatory protein
MPIYEYQCPQCTHYWNALHPMGKRDNPPGGCPECGCNAVTRLVSAPITGVDATLGPGAEFKELTRKISRGVPPSARANLERAASLRGRKYGSQ